MDAAPLFPQPQWQVSDALVPYSEALSLMDQRVQEIHAGSRSELVWLLEHPSIYTTGTSAKPEHILNPVACPIHKAGRGGQVTYHGPGQRIAYIMLDLKKRQEKPDLRGYVRGLEQWIIDTLSDFGIKGERREGRVGIWVSHKNGTEDKIAAIGVRVRKWVTLHGIALNVDPDLSYYQGIIPCGIQAHGVTSLKKLGVRASLSEIDTSLKRHFQHHF